MKIPDQIELGVVSVKVEPASPAELEESFDTCYGFYASDNCTLYYDETLSDEMIVRVVFHELVHAIEDLIFVYHYVFTEMEVEFLSIALQQVVEAFNGESR